MMFGDKEAYVMYKRIQPNRGERANFFLFENTTQNEAMSFEFNFLLSFAGNSSRGSPTGGEQRNSSWTARENNDWSYGTKGRARGPHWSNSSDQQARQAS